MSDPSEPNPVFPDDLPNDPGLTYSPPDSFSRRPAFPLSSSIAPPLASVWSIQANATSDPKISADGLVSGDDAELSQKETRAPRKASLFHQQETLSSAAPARDKAPAENPSAPGPTYTLKRVVGRGGMGEVWEARQEALKRWVAVKTIRQDSWEAMKYQPEERLIAEREFEREAFVAAWLDHPNIVPVHDLGRGGGDSPPLLAMKLVRGQTWSSLLQDDLATMREAELLAKHLPILESVAQAVAFAHSRGVIHRDLKPAQVMVGPFGEILLMDWGLAVQFGLGEVGDAASVHERLPEEISTLETAPNPAGTPALMAPEQTWESARHLGPWTDIYLLGGALYYLLTGTYPHKASTSLGAMKKAMLGYVQPPSQKAPQRWIPQPLEDLAMRALAKDPQDRPATASEFVASLRDYMTGASRRRESEEAAAQAQELFVALKAEEAADNMAAREAYRRHAAVAERLSRALELWPDNAAARRLRAQNLAARLGEEIKGGDLLLAETHLDELRGLKPNEAEGLETPALAARLAEAVKRRNRKHFWMVVFGWAATILLLLHGVAYIMAGYTIMSIHQSLSQGVAVADGSHTRDLAALIRDEISAQTRQQISPGQALTAEEIDDLARAIAQGVADRADDYFTNLDYEKWPTSRNVLDFPLFRWANGRARFLVRSEVGQELAAASRALSKELQDK
jgi:serine/threonine protein kinase